MENDIDNVRITVLEKRIFSLEDRVQNSLDSMEIKIKQINQRIEDLITQQIRQNAEQSTDLQWIKKFLWIVLTAALGGIIAQILNIA